MDAVGPPGKQSFERNMNDMRAERVATFTQIVQGVACEVARGLTPTRIYFARWAHLPTSLDHEMIQLHLQQM